MNSESGARSRGQSTTPSWHLFWSDIVLRRNIERKRLLVEAKAQGADERERDHAEDRAAEEPGPLAASTARPKETDQAACDHQEVPQGTDQDQQRDGPHDVACAQHNRKSVKPSSDEARHKEIGAVPQHGDREARAEAQGALSLGQHHDPDVDQGLACVKNPDRWIEEHGGSQRNDKQLGPDVNGGDGPG